MRTSKKMLAATLGAFVALGTAACGSGGGTAAPEDGPLMVAGERLADEQLWAAAQEEGTLTLYTAVGEERANEVVDVFREQTGLEVELVRLPGGRLVERVLTEQGAGQLGADVIMQSDLVLATQENEAGAFEPYCPPGLETVEPQLKQEDCSFYAAQTPIYAIGTNTELIPAEQAPRTWQDLLDPRFKGKIGLAHIGAGGSTWARDLFLRQKYGIEYWEALAAQQPLITGGAAGVTQQMARGEVQLGMVLPGNQSVTASQGAPLDLIVPADGIPSYAHWTGLASNAAHPNAAKVFLNWYLSMPGQTAVAQKGGDYPVIDGAPGPDFNGTPLPTREEVELVYPELTPEYASKRDAYMQEWFQIFGYAPES
ncbi:MAG: extracellular solute-binding protein [Pseudonocardiaceae bacterium]|nr:extracellular solute-binding protein [Pseudonocardiaceae bacterium]